MTDVVVTDNPDRHQFEAHLDGKLAGFAVYERSPETITFVHTVVEPEFEGHGVGGALARTALDASRAAGLDVVPQCPFIAGWIENHPDYKDLIR